ncbi:hypothetical protein L313_3043 [Acinetobacter haemolyticus CIP 64.3 = MTCC 9819]|uniref:Uncharacterized protein n=1 Tax=Acinetobacter haemolyticus CIP 64.3 = MTCC 9819 TaxID=1217659 RepID=N9F6Q8_ACIHA|nr:hypothetical protein [Acinetobacter haemolyticus]ENW18533.1 hypothetical protein F927_01312 [Acinetobacter haemolyticus CIP 64.3 = MTCC 9819]EPR90314.1 hypothetical protein L313_3043 [Acinetobacter haemolyticus CIP 64.3 = MTCC 9819]MEB6676037.1 hypothetical protein [Acinetobacter haemolyticus]NAR49511.1 hypothetical protein [Acinetobacter haemolyticus]NAR97899.1 hypothetical protein [Acinetobacter haemolyticus]
MLNIYLTDTQTHIQYSGLSHENPVKFLLNLKKIFPSTADLLLPVLPDDNNLENVTWEATSKDFEVFKKLLEGWGIIELRLSAITTYKDKNFANELVKKAQARRKNIAQTQPQLSMIALDYILMHEIHALIDAELVMIGEKFYLPTLRELWKGQFSEQILQAKF